ncbi:MAG: anaerobic ribonucleoside-triphosphate reductase activating protein [Candidatus Izemoplasmatales bacterium]|jgi:pyruvate formate lyase activating enzyme|nr:anaerobic ribonucleoside-triphosphate reductase activating protein [Candidatus Izemoplasmatales bacterium]NLF48268.1 anaerobic ribonucleoside-triphosphate reductase activating protein [Acholeplasmataceae bacterium]MDD4354353.1 anaerobic ribonucleoside-triphosphate reductase activating protein [Candidatus Izemoplasmatales bacterium]MDD4988216.1 anaerobic ribonucleoside-triphosphate reductase activating protein [Candidatus Izemoplasmatales bacterium]MDD5601687.1 anaerobic ribonucleoside-tripho
MIFAGIVKTSLIDYPGQIATVLFTPGCNFNCFYCHNRSLTEDFPQIISTEEIESYLRKRIGLIDGVVITGGEPTLHQDLPDYFRFLKQLGYLTKLDTNGSSPEMLKTLIDQCLLDYVAIDYKAPKAIYQRYCRGEADPDKVLTSINLLLESQLAFEVRTTVFPQLTQEDLIAMAEEIPIVPRYILNPYQKPLYYLPEDQEWIDSPPYTETEIRAFQETLKLYQPNVVLSF